MYAQYFGLKKSPFSLSPDPHFLSLTPKHREAFGGLLLAVTARKGFLVLTGDAGTGKTTLVRKMLSSIPATCAQFSVIVNPTLNASEFLETVLMDYGVSDIPESKALRLSLLRRLLLQAHGQGKTSVLVIDEAHLLTSDLLEEIRLLSNFETSEEKLLQIILAGQNELNTVLDQESRRHIKQRVAVRLDLAPLAAKDVLDYMQKRWTCAGGPGSIPFSDSAVALVARGSGGIPRMINAICDAVLTNVYGRGASRIEAEDMLEVLGEMHLIPPSTRDTQQILDRETAPVTAETHPALIDSPPPFVFRSFQRYTPAASRGHKTFRWTQWFGLGSESRS
jgi:general secretion pathway protein A